MTEYYAGIKTSTSNDLVFQCPMDIGCSLVNYDNPYYTYYQPYPGSGMDYDSYEFNGITGEANTNNLINIHLSSVVHPSRTWLMVEGTFNYDCSWHNNPYAPTVVQLTNAEINLSFVTVTPVLSRHTLPRPLRPASASRMIIRLG